MPEETSTHKMMKLMTTRNLKSCFFSQKLTIRTVQFHNLAFFCRLKLFCKICKNKFFFRNCVKFNDGDLNNGHRLSLYLFSNKLSLWKPGYWPLDTLQLIVTTYITEAIYVTELTTKAMCGNFHNRGYICHRFLQNTLMLCP